MSFLSDQKSSILQKITQLKQLDLFKIYQWWPVYTPWNNYLAEEIKPYVLYTVDLLTQIQENPSILDVFQIWQLQNLDSYIQNSVNSYSSQNIVSLDASQITTQHHDFLNQFQNIFNILWSSPYGNAFPKKFLNLTKDVSWKIARLQPNIDKLIAKEKIFDAAIESAEKWLSDKQKIQDEVIKDQAKEYLSRAHEHKVHDNRRRFFSWWISGSWWWLFGTFIFASATALVTYSLYDTTKSEDSISIWSAILHIATVIVPAYLTVFCASQFLYHKKMYESYMFKNASLWTMNYLLSINAGDVWKSDKILWKGLDILFSEPSGKEDSQKLDKTLVTELIKLATSWSKAW